MTLDELIDELQYIRNMRMPSEDRGSYPVYVYDEGWASGVSLRDPVDDEETPYIMIECSGQ